MLSSITARLRQPKQWLFWLGMLVYTLLFSELYVRVFDPVILTPRYVVDSGYGVRGNWPGMTYSHYSAEYGDIPFSINSKGLRADSDIPYDKPNDTLRIMAFGDSFTIGYGATEDQTYLARMGAAVQDSTDCRVETINMGVSGFGNAEGLVALEREGYRYAPDVVVFQWHRTDLKDNLRARLFRLADGQLEEENEDYLPLVGVRERLFSNSLYRALAANSMAYTWVRNSLARVTKKSLWRSGMQAADTFDEAEVAEAIGQNYSAGTLIEQRLAIAILQRAQRFAESLGAQFMILDVPVRVDRSTFRSTFPRRSGLTDVLYSPIDDFSARNGEILYWEHSAGHFSTLGNQVVGAALAERVASHSCGQDEG